MHQRRGEVCDARPRRPQDVGPRLEEEGVRPATRRLILLHEACAVGPLCELAGGRVAAAVWLLAEYEAHAPRPQRAECVLQRAPGLGLGLGLA